MRVLVTRPAESGAGTAQALRFAGHEPILVPLSTLEATGAGLPEGSFDFLVATSGNVFRFIPPQAVRRLAHLPMHVVGEACARAGIAAGWLQPFIGPGTAAGLAAELCDRYGAASASPGPTGLYLTGTPRRPELETLLAGARIALGVAVLYRNAPLPALPAPAREALGGAAPIVVLHYSAEGARTFRRLSRGGGVDLARPGIGHVAMSTAVADALLESDADLGGGLRQIAVAPVPTETAMIATVAALAVEIAARRG